MGDRARMACIVSVVLMALVFVPAAAAQTTREGILRATIGDDFARGESTTTYSIHSGGEATRLLPTAPVAVSTGDRVVAKGSIHDGTLVGQVTQEQDLTPEADLAEPRKVAVLLIGFSGGPAPWSAAQARREVFTGERSANAFFAEESYGEISLAGKLDPEGDVFGPYSVNPAGGCAADAWDAEAREAAEDDEVSLAGYDHIVYVFPFRSACGWLGRATFGGGTVNINGALGGSQVVAHELGHNLHLGHAGSWVCTKGGARVPISDSCTTNEYGDPFDVMGNLGMRHNSGSNLLNLGVLSLAENVETGGALGDGIYTLRSALTPSPTPKVLRVARPVNEPGAPVGWYYLEIRERGGIFEDFVDASTTGVSIRILGASSAAETVLIDSTPSTPDFYDAPFQAGRTYSDGFLHVTVLSAGAGSATVSIGFGAYEDEEEPNAPTALSAGQVGEDVRLSWNASGDNVAVARYVVFRDGAEIATRPTTSFTDTSPVAGQHAYTVHAEDEAGNRSEPSAAQVVDVAEVTGPPEPPGTSDEDAPPRPSTAPSAPSRTLSVRSVGAGSGSVSDGTGAISCPPACSHSYAAGTPVALTATPVPGSRFDGWLGGGCGSAGACRLAMGTDASPVAIFVRRHRAGARLRIARVRRRLARSKLEIALAGTIAARARGVVRVRVVARLRGQRAIATGRGRIVRGRWRVRLALPRAWRASRGKIHVAARYGGGPGLRVGHARRRIGLPRSLRIRRR